MNECMCRHLVECLTNGLISAYLALCSLWHNLLYIHLRRSMQLGDELSIRFQFQQYIYKNISKEEKFGYEWVQIHVVYLSLQVYHHRKHMCMISIHMAMLSLKDFFLFLDLGGRSIYISPFFVCCIQNFSIDFIATWNSRMDIIYFASNVLCWHLQKT